MDESTINAMFKPKPSKQEAKADTTTRVAREILDSESRKRDAKTERLRLARLASEASDTEAPAAKPKVKAKAKAKAKPKAKAKK
ncbi:hypothetical protein [Mesorhizobium sp. CAU 1741]|uniref:hypothetical protein n=1 Tax=Mesorhizobium sp. CAU 1741 TaxID=3140366 RepID=UPI00325AE020